MCGLCQRFSPRFCCGFTIVWQYINIPCFRRDQGMLFSWVFNYFYVGLVLLLFMHFRMRRRAVPATAERAARAAPRARGALPHTYGHLLRSRAELRPAAQYSPGASVRRHTNTPISDCLWSTPGTFSTWTTSERGRR